MWREPGSSCWRQQLFGVAIAERYNTESSFHNNVKMTIPCAEGTAGVGPTPKRRASSGNEFKCLRSARSGSLALKSNNRFGGGGVRRGEGGMTRLAAPPVPSHQGPTTLRTQDNRQGKALGNQTAGLSVHPSPGPGSMESWRSAGPVRTSSSRSLLFQSQGDGSSFYLHAANRATSVPGPTGTLGLRCDILPNGKLYEDTECLHFRGYQGWMDLSITNWRQKRSSRRTKCSSS